MTKSLALGCRTVLTGLRICTGCRLIAMRKRIALCLLTYRTGLGSSTGSSLPAMTGRIDNEIGGFIITSCALLVCGMTGLGTSGILLRCVLKSVSESNYLGVNVFVATAISLTDMSCVAFRSTSGIGDHALVIVVKSRLNLLLLCGTSGTAICSHTVGFTSGLGSYNTIIP